MTHAHGYDLSPTEGGNYFMSMAYLARGKGPIRESDDPYDTFDSEGHYMVNALTPCMECKRAHYLEETDHSVAIVGWDDAYNSSSSIPIYNNVVKLYVATGEDTTVLTNKSVVGENFAKKGLNNIEDAYAIMAEITSQERSARAAIRKIDELSLSAN